MNRLLLLLIFIPVLSLAQRKSYEIKLGGGMANLFYTPNKTNYKMYEHLEFLYRFNSIQTGISYEQKGAAFKEEFSNIMAYYTIKYNYLTIPIYFHLELPNKFYLRPEIYYSYMISSIMKEKTDYSMTKWNVTDKTTGLLRHDAGFGLLFGRSIKLKDKLQMIVELKSAIGCLPTAKTKYDQLKSFNYCFSLSTGFLFNQ